MDKDTRKVVEALEAQGFEVKVTKKGHLKVTREGVMIAVLAGTASDWRSLRNGLSVLRRHGFRWPPNGR
jgi:hypothetical protein